MTDQSDISRLKALLTAARKLLDDATDLIGIVEAGAGESLESSPPITTTEEAPDYSVGSGSDGGNQHIEAPSSAADSRTDPIEPSSDWIAAARAVFAGMKPAAQRSRFERILVERSLRIGSPQLILETLGEAFDLTRERVRQLENDALRQLNEQAAVISLGPVGATAQRIRAELGPIFSAPILSAFLDLGIDPAELGGEVEILLHFAGPFEMVGDRFVRKGFISELRQQVEEYGPVDHDGRIRTWLTESRAQKAEWPTLFEEIALREIDDTIVSWRGTLADKAATVLAVQGDLMSSQSIHDVLGEGELRTLKNYLSGDDRFQRRTKDSWGLSEWGGGAYATISDQMAEQLAGFPRGMALDRLQTILAERFGTNRISVQIMSATHPKFVRDGNDVRLRRADEPYEVDSAIELNRRCVVVADSWAWMHKVSTETKRGTGLAIPEPFAFHLGIAPGSERTVGTNLGNTIRFYWSAQDPSVGSLKGVAETMGAELDDTVIVRTAANGLEFSLVRQTSLTTGSPKERLLAHLGQASQEDHWLATVAKAVGLDGSSTADEVRARLALRGDSDAAELFEHALQVEGDDSEA